MYAVFVSGKMMVEGMTQLNGLSVQSVTCGFIVFVLGQNLNVVLSVVQLARIIN